MRFRRSRIRKGRSHVGTAPLDALRDRHRVDLLTGVPVDHGSRTFSARARIPSSSFCEVPSSSCEVFPETNSGCRGVWRWRVGKRAGTWNCLHTQPHVSPRKGIRNNKTVHRKVVYETCAYSFNDKRREFCDEWTRPLASYEKVVGRSGRKPLTSVRCASLYSSA